MGSACWGWTWPLWRSQTLLKHTKDKQATSVSAFNNKNNNYKKREGNITGGEQSWSWVHSPLDFGENIFQKWIYSPVGCKFLTYKATRDLRDDVAPKKGAMDHSHCLWIPCELSSLWKGRKWLLIFSVLTLWAAVTDDFYQNSFVAQTKQLKWFYITSIKKQKWRIQHFDFSHSTHHKHFLVTLVDSVVVDHAHNGHAQIAPDAERDAEPQARQDGDDVSPWQAKASAIHNWQLLLLNQFRTSLCRKLNSFSIGLPLLDQPEASGRDSGKSKQVNTEVCMCRYGFLTRLPGDYVAKSYYKQNSQRYWIIYSWIQIVHWLYHIFVWKKTDWNLAWKNRVRGRGESTVRPPVGQKFV